MPFYRCIPPANGGGGGGSDSCGHITVVDNGVTYEPLISFKRDICYFTNAYGNYSTFNSPITIGNKVLSSENLCSGCRNFNSPVDMTNATSLSWLYNTFYGCWNFNLPINFPRSENLCVYHGVFQAASNYNQPTKFYLSTNVTSVIGSLYSAFAGCSSFNSRVDFEFLSGKSDNIKAMKYDFAFSGASNFNQPLLLRRVSGFNNLLNNAISMECPLLIDLANTGDSSYGVLTNTKVNTVIILNYAISPRNIQWFANSVGATYYVDDVTNFSTKSQWLTESIRNSVSFTQVTNGLYNSAYNIYILNNVNDGCNYFNNFYYNCYGEYPTY